MSSIDFIHSSMEVCGAIICFISVFLLYIIADVKQKSTKIVVLAVLTQIIALLSDATWYIFNGDMSQLGQIGNWCCNIIVYLCNPIEIACVLVYMYSVLEEHGLYANKIVLKIIYFLLGITVLLTVANCFSPILYFFDEYNIYNRADGLYIYIGICMTALLIEMCFLVYYRKRIGFGNFVAGFIFILAPIAGTVLQMFFLGIPWINAGITISLLLMIFIYLKQWAIEKNSTNKLILLSLFVMFVLFISASIFSAVFALNKVAIERSEKESCIMAYVVNEAVNSMLAKPMAVAETMSYSNHLKLDLLATENDARIEEDIVSYLNSIKEGTGCDQVFAVSDKRGIYYTYQGINKHIDPKNDSHDVWYKNFKYADKVCDFDVDVDEMGKLLSVSVNTAVRSNDGEFLGVCGVSVNMHDLQERLKDLEEEYNIDIKITDENDLLQAETVDISGNIQDGSFHYERKEHSAVVIRYMENCGMYLVIEDHQPNKIDIVKSILPSVFVFMLGLVFMLIIFKVLDLHANSIMKELRRKKKLSETDTLTGLYNRNAYEIHSAYLCDNSQLNKFAVIMIDINGLKRANDHIGHEAGDELIKGTASCLYKIFSSKGKVYRTGGDEFVVTLSNVDYDLDNMLDSFLDEVNCWEGEIMKKLSVSIGIAGTDEYPGIGFTELVKIADKRMYEYKNEYYRRTGNTRGT